MSVANASVTAASFTMQITQATVNPITIAPTIQVPLTFGTSTYVNTTSGSYTPANDTKTIHTFSTVNDLPKWLLVVVDQPVSLTMTTSAAHTPAAQFPIQRMLFLGNPTPLNNWNTLVLDGTTANPNYAMTQNVAVNYSVFWGDGSLS